VPSFALFSVNSLLQFGTFETIETIGTNETIETIGTNETKLKHLEHIWNIWTDRRAIGRRRSRDTSERRLRAYVSIYEYFCENLLQIFEIKYNYC